MVNTYPLVSIVTLCYKKFDFVFGTINSVLKQDYPNIEYVISDDGSDNFPYKKIERFIAQNKRSNIVDIKIITREKNIGTVRHANDVYMKCAGKFILPLSADDEFYSFDAVTKIIDRMIEIDADILCTSRLAYIGDTPVCYLPKKNNIQKIKKLDTPQKQYNAFIEDKFWDMASGSVLYIKKTFFEKMNGYDERFFLWEDGPFLTKITQAGFFIRFAFDITSINYRLGGVSNGGFNTLLGKDILLYNELYRKKSEYVSTRAKRQIMFYEERFLNLKNGKIKPLLFLKYMDIIAIKSFEKLIDLKNCLKDKKIILKQIEKGEIPCK